MKGRGSPRGFPYMVLSRRTLAIWKTVRRIVHPMQKGVSYAPNSPVTRMGAPGSHLLSRLRKRQQLRTGSNPAGTASEGLSAMIALAATTTVVGLTPLAGETQPGIVHPSSRTLEERLCHRGGEAREKCSVRQ